jgi:ligand-binding sensor domain-containing protein/AraC-like DNA-binding protein
MPTGKESLPHRSGSPKAILILLIAATGSMFPATSIELKKELERWVHRSWTTENGLPQDTVYALAQASDGSLWIGSEGGLARFDGTAFTIFKKNTTLGLESNSITSLSPAPDGALWLGTFGGGLVRLREGKFHRIAGLTGDRVWSLHHDRLGVLWALLADDGAYCLEEGGEPSLAVIDGMPDDQITAIAGSEEDTLWIGTRGGLAAIRNGRETVFSSRDGLAGDYVYCLFTDSRGSLWVGTTTGLSRIDPAGIRSFSTADGLADDLVRAIGEDAQGRLWIGTNRGVTVMAPGEKVLCASPASLAGDAVMAICRDREGGMWIGTSSGGLRYLRRNEVRVYETGDGLSGQQLRSICEDPAGRLWVGTRDRGLNRMENGNWRSYSRRDGLVSDFITALAADPRGRLWIGTLDAGLQLLEQDRFKAVRPADRPILSLFVDHQENLWIGSDGSGLDCCRDGAWQHHGAARGLKGSVITALGEDRQGNIWAGSVRDGLHILHQGAWHQYKIADGLAGDTVYAIHVDDGNSIWLGTNGGLGLLRQGKCFAFQEGPALLNGTILAILEDGSGGLWMSSPAGIFCARRPELESAAASGGRGVHCRLFGEMSGMKSTVCTGGFQPAGCKSRDGKLWFPTQKGLVMIDPARLEAEPPVPLPRIERVQAEGLTVPLSNGYVFPAGTERFDFRYAAASFYDPQQVEFSTRLDGLEEGWSKPVKERSRHVARLGAGAYVFRIRARGPSGAWNEGADGFSFSIRPYFHQTPWFFALFLASAGMAVAGFLSYRGRKARKRREDKYKLSTLSAEKTAEYVACLERAMEKDKLYLDPDLTLVKLAELTAIPAKHLSQVINERFSLNFNDFINRHRVEEAKRRLLDPSARDFKLLRIAFEAGFNSKSVFNGAFRKNTGLSPSEFRRLLGGGGVGGPS